MTLRLVQANLKAHDDTTLGRFWAHALGWTTTSSGHGATSVAPTGYDWTAPDAPVTVDVITVPDPRTVHHHAHLDLATTSTTHHAALVAHLLDLGATPPTTTPTCTPPPARTCGSSAHHTCGTPSDASTSTSSPPPAPTRPPRSPASKFSAPASRTTAGPPPGPSLPTPAATSSASSARPDPPA